MAKGSTGSGLVRCRESFVLPAGTGHTSRVVQAGEVFDADDPVVKVRARHFETVEAAAERARAERGGLGHVEQATAAPGERRAVRIPRSEATSEGK